MAEQVSTDKEVTFPATVGPCKYSAFAEKPIVKNMPIIKDMNNGPVNFSTIFLYFMIFIFNGPNFLKNSFPESTNNLEG